MLVELVEESTLDINYVVLILGSCAIARETIQLFHLLPGLTELLKFLGMPIYTWAPAFSHACAYFCRACFLS